MHCWSNAEAALGSVGLMLGWPNGELPNLKATEIKAQERWRTHWRNEFGSRGKKLDEPLSS